MRGLPFAATPDDIVYWFNSAGLPIQPLTAERYATWASILTLENGHTLTSFVRHIYQQKLLVCCLTDNGFHPSRRILTACLFTQQMSLSQNRTAHDASSPVPEL